MAEYLERSHAPGSVVVFGTPGEEMMPPVAKTDMYQAGVFNAARTTMRRKSGITASWWMPNPWPHCCSISPPTPTTGRR